MGFLPSIASCSVSRCLSSSRTARERLAFVNGSASTVLFDGRTADELAATLHVPRVVLFAKVGSTLDITHQLGDEGAVAGTLVLADEQTAGRGRLGRSWQSDRGAGIWLTLLERPAHDDALGVLALRLALALAPALETYADAPLQLKWPNDIFTGDKKLAGVLVEARWRGPRLDWLAVGVGINLRAPERFGGASLTDGVDRVAVLRDIIPGLRSAVSSLGPLTENELARFRARDLALGRQSTAPGRGIVAGVRADGALLVDGSAGREAYHAGSLVLTGDNSLGSQP
jgi:BirA family biotin operon repressor/biotin-[acetyl-CoA-carboxylase] ligase